MNINFKEDFEKKGMIFLGLSPDSKLPEIIELKTILGFIGVQFTQNLNLDLWPHILYSLHLLKPLKSSRQYNEKS